MATAPKKSLVTHVGCPSCRLRFAAAAPEYLVACPECGRPPQLIAGAEGVLGFRLFVVEDVPVEELEALAVSMPIPGPGEATS